MNDSTHSLGGFRLLDTAEPVGEGRQGAIRRAVCERADFPGLPIGATVALKVMPVLEADDDSWLRLSSMVSALATMEASEVVRHFGCFRVRGDAGCQHVVVMEYLSGMPGQTLRNALNASGQRGLPTEKVLAAFVRYAHGLAVLHAQGIVHRDIKPSNLYYPSEDVGKSAILDLGVACEGHVPRATGFVPGTPDYMPPEVVTGASHGSPAADVYALGCCLYEALTGRSVFPRFKGGTSAALEAFVVRARQMRAPKLDAPLVVANPDLERLLRRMTEQDVACRTPSAAEVEMDLLGLIESLERGDWRFPPEEEVGGEPIPDGADDTQTVEETVDLSKAETPPIPFLRRFIRNRRELFLVLALIIELASNAIIIWCRPRSYSVDARPAVGAERGR